MASDRLENERFVKSTYFDKAQVRLTRLAGRFVTDVDTVIAEASAIFDDMLPSLAYVDKPLHPLAPALFICTVTLALYLALKRRGIDAHDFGKAMLEGLARAPIPIPVESQEVLQEQLVQFTAAAEASQNHPMPGEDVFEIVGIDQADFDWGYNVTSCAILTAAAQYEATELVPYMCAVDDVMSAKGDQGLRRSGSLALGALRCDFRFKRGGLPQRLAEQYPDRIRIIGKGSPEASAD